MASPPSSIDRSATAPATTACECWANSSKKRSSFGIRRWNQRNMITLACLLGRRPPRNDTRRRGTGDYPPAAPVAGTGRLLQARPTERSMARRSISSGAVHLGAQPQSIIERAAPAQELARSYPHVCEPGPGATRLGFWRAAHVDHVAIAVGGVGIDVARDQHPAIE